MRSSEGGADADRDAVKGVRLIVIAGQIGAGKSTAASYLERTFGIRHMSFVDLIWKRILAERGLEPTRRNLQILGVELMRDIGPRALVDRLLATCAPESWATVDDVRSPSVLDSIVVRVPGSSLLFMQASFDSRFPRLVIRDGVKDEEEQREAEAFPTETDIDSLRSRARWIIHNDGDERSLRLSLDRVVEDLGIERGSDA